MLDKMRCLRKRSTVSFLGVLVVFLLFMNLYIEDSYVLVSFGDIIFSSKSFSVNFVSVCLYPNLDITDSIHMSRIIYAYILNVYF